MLRLHYLISRSFVWIWRSPAASLFCLKTKYFNVWKRARVVRNNSTAFKFSLFRTVSCWTNVVFAIFPHFFVEFLFIHQDKLKMPVTTPATKEDRLKSFKNKGKDNEVRIILRKHKYLYDDWLISKLILNYKF